MDFEPFNFNGPIDNPLNPLNMLCQIVAFAGIMLFAVMTKNVKF
jgi:hypothetical protein